MATSQQQEQQQHQHLLISFLQFCILISLNGCNIWNQQNVTVEQDDKGQERRMIIPKKSNEKNCYIFAIVGHGPHYFSVCVEEFDKQGNPVIQTINQIGKINETCELYEILYHPDKLFYEYRFESSVPIY